MFKILISFLLLPLFLFLLTVLVVLFPNVMMWLIIGMLWLVFLFCTFCLSFLIFGKIFLGEEERDRILDEMDTFI
jgi:hypothetical protein